MEEGKNLMYLISDFNFLNLLSCAVCFSALGMHYLCNKSKTDFQFLSNAQNSKRPKYHIRSANSSV